MTGRSAGEDAGAPRAQREFVALDPSSHVFVIAPHPDDEVLSFGGALREHVLRGGRATVIAVTDGEGADDLADEGQRRELIATRAEERTEALRALDVPDLRVVRLRFPDGHVADREDELSEVLRRTVSSATISAAVGPTVVAPWRFDRHPDHEASGRATARAVEGLPALLLEVPIWGWYAAQQGAVPGDGAFGGGIAISDATRRAKSRALRCFASQLDPLPGGRGPVLPPDFLRAFDRSFEPVA